ncbi:MAG: CRISPR system precrRNA processing endoribonuclease RAMP protein Cas6 [Coriobacteriia bacterium]|nr:CRISPR system precrRNA processing endoribonuclease RAMP protein Cas6 [Coriobacteriia bacterium]
MAQRVPELVALNLQLEACTPSRFPHGAGFWAYAAILRLMESFDPVAAAEAHGGPASDKRALVTVSGVLKDSCSPLDTVELEPGESAHLRIATVGPRAVAALARSLELCRRPLVLELGPYPVHVVGVEPAETASQNPASLDDLYERAMATRGPICMRFLSPTTFERRRLWYALPAPEAVFGRPGPRPSGLFRHFVMLRQPEPPCLDPSHVGAVMRWIEPCIARLALDGGVQWTARAFRGECEYVAPPEETARLHILGLLAEYTGVGQRVSFGMGQVRVSFPIS